MRFNEKLQILRKEKKLSQEQLADMLDVTRQSVSKWESGTTYPEMDKLIMLCKIFKCSLDDLTNDEVSEIVVEKKNSNNSFSLNNILDSFFGFIGKTVKMFQAMSFKQIVKCIFTMFLFGCLLMFFYIPFSILEEGFESFTFQFGPNGWLMLFRGTFSFILNMIFFILYAMVFVYVFKIAYLDKYEFVSGKKTSDDVERVDEVKETVKEVTIVEHTPEPRDNALLKILGGIVLGFIKFLLACFSLMAMFILIVLCFLLALDAYLIIDGLVFIGSFLGLVFAIVLCIWFLESISIFIFNRKVPFKRLLITFIVGLSGLGVSLGIFLLEVYNVDYIDELPVIEDVKLETKKEVVPMSEKLAISTYIVYENYVSGSIEYVADESMSNDVSIELSYYPLFSDWRIDVSSDVVTLHKYYIDDFNTTKILFKSFKKNLENKKVYNYDKYHYQKIVVTTSQQNIDKIKVNSRKLYEDEQIRQYNYDIRINNYENIISEYETELEDLKERNEVLQDKIDELEDYKNRVKDNLLD